MPLFNELSLILLISFLAVSVLKLLKQPLIIGYIAAGVIAGPYFLQTLRHVETVELFSKIGITALLFIIGLNLSPRVIKDLGVVALVIGIGQILITSSLGYFLSMLLGFKPLESLYIAIALTFSSTIIILKLLTDKGDIHNLYGRISIGFLLVQDLVATIILVAIASVAGISGEDNVLYVVSMTLLKGFLLLVGLFFISVRILPKLDSFLAKSQELLFIFSLAWGMGIAALYEKLGLSIEIGALVAGVALSMTPYVHEVSSRLRPLRDFFVIMFFILLGSQIVLDSWASYIIPIILFSAFVIVGKPFILFFLMNLLGYTKRTSFFVGLTSAQISEFSLILIALGLQIGHLNREVLSATTIVGVITIALSGYFIIYSEKIYLFMSKFLTMIEMKKAKRDKGGNNSCYKAILFGYHRVGGDFVSVFKNAGMNFMVVDYNPDAIAVLNNLQIAHEYGDADDIEFLAELPLHSVSIVVSTIPDFNTNALIVSEVRKVNKDAVVIIISDNVQHTKDLYTAGASYVIMPHYIGAELAAGMINRFKFNGELYEEEKTRHLKYLMKRV